MEDQSNETVENSGDPVVENSEDPFKGDLLGRKKTCEIWTKSIEERFEESPDEPFVLAVDAEWGNGKTTFIEMWIWHLEEAKFKTVFFDAWKADFYDEALPALIGAIQSEVGSSEGLKGKITRLLKRIPYKSIPGAIIEALAGERGKGLREIFRLKSKHVDRVQDYIEYGEAVDEFKAELKKVVKQTKKFEEKKPLVIFIDELDRCRPIFALEVLEKVKHIFDVEGVFFVIAVNKDSLIKTIESEYGQIDGNLYLEKFFDRTMTLQSNKRMFIEKLIKEMWGMEHPHARKSSMDMFLSVVQLFNLSLREQKKIIIECGRMGEQEKANISERWGILPILIFFSTLKIVNPDLFRKIITVPVAKNNTDSMVFPVGDIKKFLEKKVKPYEQPDSPDGTKVIIMDAFISVFIAKLGDIEYEETLARLISYTFHPAAGWIEGYTLDIEEFFEKTIPTYVEARLVFAQILTLIEEG